MIRQGKSKDLQLVVQEAAKQMIGIPLCFLLAKILFASRESLKVSSTIQEVGIQQRLQKHIGDTGGNIHLAAHDQLFPFSATKRYLYNN